jgi:hypothetical protein
MSRALAVALVLVAMLVATPPVAAQTTHTLGPDSHLGTEAAAIEFAQTGTTSTSQQAPDVTVTAARTDAECAVKRTEVAGFEFGGPSDFRNDYVCFEYDETIERTFEVYLTNGIWPPYEDPNVESVSNSSAQAAFDAVSRNGQRYLRVQVTLSEPGTYTFPVNQERSFVMGRLGRTQERIENVSGVSVAGDGDWQRVNASAFENGSTHIVKAPNGTDELLFEYREPGTAAEWQQMPSRDRDAHPVYYNLGSETEAQVIVTDPQNPPDVRYKTNAETGDRLGTAIREILSIGDRLEDAWPLQAGGIR